MAAAAAAVERATDATAQAAIGGGGGGAYSRPSWKKVVSYDSNSSMVKLLAYGFLSFQGCSRPRWKSEGLYRPASSRFRLSCFFVLQLSVTYSRTRSEVGTPQLLRHRPRGHPHLTASYSLSASSMPRGRWSENPSTAIRSPRAPSMAASPAHPHPRQVCPLHHRGKHRWSIVIVFPRLWPTGDPIIRSHQEPLQQRERGLPRDYLRGHYDAYSSFRHLSRIAMNGQPSRGG